MGARKITEDDIILINRLYLLSGTYAAVARETGFSPATVKKYIIDGFVPPEQQVTTKFTLDDIPESYAAALDDVDDFGELCVLSDEEAASIKELWKELIL